MFGFGNAAQAPQPAAPARAHHQEPVIGSPAARPQPPAQELYAPAPEPARAAVRPAQIDEIGLEIPAFLRRSQ
jgi:cell division protein FtsZ